MFRLLLPFALATAAYGYWKYIAFAPPELRRQRLQKAASWAVFVVTLVAAARSGSLLWLIGTGAVMVVMRYLAHVGSNRKSSPGSETANPGPSAPRSGGRMSRAEALQIFELGENPSAEAIQKRYRDLMRTMHPDRGGSNYLAAKLNEAYQVLTVR